MTRIDELSLFELIRVIKERKVSCLELMNVFLENVKEYNKISNVIVSIDFQQCLKEAVNADNDLANNIYRGPLHGIPLGVKDNYLTSNYPTTACSDVLKEEDNKSIDAPVLKLLKKQGAIIMAKTNMHEWAFGATNLLSNIGNTKNPWNKMFITGGSSGGSAAGLAQRMFPLALGSDTGGSIRIPAACCGISGLKPSYSLINKEGVYPLSFSLDVVGPMAKTAEDLEIIFELMLDEKIKKEINYYKDYQDLKGMTFAIPVGSNFERTKDVESVFVKAIEKIKSLGAKVEEVELPFMKEALGAWKAILYSEATAYHQNNLKSKPNAFSKNVKLMIECGESISAVDYIKANQFRSIFIKEIDSILKKYDGFLFTTLPVSVPLIDEDELVIGNNKVSCQNSMTYLAWFANYLGTPQVSIPCGVCANELPIGLAIMCNIKEDFKLLKISKCFQTHTDFHKRVYKKIKVT